LEVYQKLRRQIGKQRFDKNAELRDNYMQLLLTLGKKEPKYLEQLRQIREGVYSSQSVDDIDKILLKIRSLLLDDRLNEAINSLDEEFIEHPDNQSLQDLYLSALVRQQGPAEALKYLNEATHRASDPWEDRSDFLVRRAQWIGSLEDPEVFGKLKDLEAEIQNYDESDWPYFWKEMAKVYYGLSPSRLVEVTRCLRRAAELDPEDHWVAQRLFELAMQENSERRMLNTLAKVADRFGKESDLWCFLQARYRFWKYDQQQDVEASLAGVEELIDRLASIRPRWHKLLVLRGDLAHREEQIEEAIDFYKESLDLGPLDNTVTQQLVELLVNEGRLEE
jgi:tetratricopeptide (TPR) repeat protein